MYDEAEPFYKRAIAINEQRFGPDHPLVAVSLNNLGELMSSKVGFLLRTTFCKISTSVSRSLLRDTIFVSFVSFYRLLCSFSFRFVLVLSCLCVCVKHFWKQMTFSSTNCCTSPRCYHASSLHFSGSITPPWRSTDVPSPSTRKLSNLTTRAWLQV